MSIAIQTRFSFHILNSLKASWQLWLEKATQFSCLGAFSNFLEGMSLSSFVAFGGTSSSLDSLCRAEAKWNFLPL